MTTTPELTLTDRAAAAIDVYRNHLDFTSANELGRPGTVVASLNMMAGSALEPFRAAGVEVELKLPELDFVHDDPTDEHGTPRPDPGRYKPSRNRAFLQAHRRNVSALENAIRQLRAIPTKDQVAEESTKLDPKGRQLVR